MTTSVFEPTAAGVTVAHLGSLISVLAVVSGVVMGAVVLIIGWRWFGHRRTGGYRWGGRVPLGGATGKHPGGVR
ncbi:MAG: hypothetical protein ACT4NY_28225 [Pseudonocardiales bacterium]